MKNLLLSLLVFYLSTGLLSGQDRGTLKGSVRDSVGDPVDLANVALLGTGEGTMTDVNGTFEMEVPAGRSYTVVVSCVGYRTEQFAVRLQSGETREMNVSLNREDRKSVV